MSDSPPAAAKRGRFALPLLAVVALTGALAFTPLTSGFFQITAWGPLALAAIVVLIAAVALAKPRLTADGMLAWAGLAALLTLSALSLLWAQSTQNAWTDTDRLALYVVIFTLALTTIRTLRTARLLVPLLGAAALGSALVLSVLFVFHGGAGAFLARRLNSPVGYINGTAGLMAMGIWPWLSLAENADRRSVRAGAHGAATLIACAAVLTQSRAVVPAVVVALVLALIVEPGRARRGLLLALMFVGVIIALPELLHVYTQGGFSDHNLPPTHSALRAAGVAALASAVLVTAARYLSSVLLQRLDRSRSESLLSRAGKALGVAVVLMLVLGLAFGFSHIRAQFHAFVNDKNTSQTSVRFLEASGPRYDLWRVALDEFTEHPLGGIGAGNYDTDYYRLRHTSAYVQNPHSIELQMLAELGIFGLLALLLFCGAVFRSGFRRSGTLASQDRLVRIAALGVFTTWLVETSVDWLYDIPGLTGMALVAAAMLLAAPEAVAAEPETDRGETDAREGRTFTPRFALLLVGLAALAAAASSIGRQYAGALDQNSGSLQILTAPQRALAELHSSFELNPYNTQTLYWIADSYEQLGDLSDERTALLLAARREPSNYVPPALLGELAAQRHQNKLARGYYRRSLQLNPIDPLIRRRYRELNRR